MNIATAHLADSANLPPLDAFYQYVVAQEGLYLRAENDFFSVLVLVAASERNLNGAAALAEGITLRIPKVPSAYLTAARVSAKRHLPNEAMYQLRWDAIAHSWDIEMPKQKATPTSLSFDDLPGTVLDLHSHGDMAAFFSGTDNADEQGLRLYVVIGKVDTDEPEILCRVGVYGHHLTLPATDLFESIAPFVDRYKNAEREHALDDDLSIENEPGIYETESGIAVAKF